MKFRRSLWFLFAVLGFILLATQTRGIWLPWVAKNLIVADQPRRSDLIVVFAAEEERAKHAAQLYREGLAPRILVTGELILKGVEVFCQKQVTGADLSAQVLAAAGIPKSAVVVIRRGTSTYEEAEVMKSFAEQNGYRSLIAVSSPYHMRRVRATFSHLLHRTGISVQYSSAPRTAFNPNEWWRHERDLIHVTNEYLKLAYYHLALF